MEFPDVRYIGHDSSLSPLVSRSTGSVIGLGGKTSAVWPGGNARRGRMMPSMRCDVTRRYLRNRVDQRSSGSGMAGRREDVVLATKFGMAWAKENRARIEQSYDARGMHYAVADRIHDLYHPEPDVSLRSRRHWRAR